MNKIQSLLGCSGMALMFTLGGGVAVYGLARLLSA
jgi:hypothetical protein